jgi:hypothetical protein
MSDSIRLTGLAPARPEVSMLLATTLLAAVLAQSPPSATTVDAVNARFLELETRLAGALQQKDSARLDSMLAAGFAYSRMIADRAPDVVNRAEWLRIADELATLERFEIKYLAAGERGSVAVVRFQLSRKGKLGSKELEGEHAVVDVWTKEKGAWALAYRVVSRPDASLKP